MHIIKPLLAWTLAGLAACSPGALLPTIPTSKEIPGSAQFAQCVGFNTTARFYDYDGDSLAELVVMFYWSAEQEAVPFLYMEFEGADPTADPKRLVLALPGEKPREVVLEEALKTYPTVCDFPLAAS